MTTMKNEIPDYLVAFAAVNDAAIISQARYGVAVQARIYREDGTRETRFYPDSCDFRAPEAWGRAIEAGVASRWIC